MRFEKETHFLQKNHFYKYLINYSLLITIIGLKFIEEERKSLGWIEGQFDRARKVLVNGDKDTDKRQFEVKFLDERHFSTKDKFSPPENQRGSEELKEATSFEIT